MEAEDVKRLRQVLGLTQKELAEKIGVSIKTITNYETGGVIPHSKQQLLISLLEIATLNVDVESISIDESGQVIAKEKGVAGKTIKGVAINTGTVGGHNVSVQGGDYEKIIDKDKIELIGGNASKIYLQEIASLKAEIIRLEAIIKSKDETIAAKDETIEILRKK